MGLRLVRREYPTDIGPVDLLCRDADGAAVAVEVKRRGEIDGVEQLTRYLELLNRDPMLRPVRGMFVAQQIKPQAKVLAADRGIELASRSTTTSCAASSPPSSACSERPLDPSATASLAKRPPRTKSLCLLGRTIRQVRDGCAVAANPLILREAARPVGWPNGAATARMAP